MNGILVPKFKLDIFGHLPKSVILDNSILSNELELRRTLVNHSVVYLPRYDTGVLNYIVDEYCKLQISGQMEYITDVLGWQNIPNMSDKYFILEKIVLPGMAPIRYHDQTFNFQSGSEAGQIEFLRKEIIPYKETRFAMVIGLSSVVASLIDDQKSIGSLIMNISGKSSTGKSTIAELSASFFGSPKLSNNGLVRSFNATPKFILSISEGRCGLPIILDDANSNKGEHSKSQLIYQFAEGEPRGRCASNGTPQSSTRRWSGIVMITSESPIIDEEKMFTGALVRTLTINDLIWTQDAEHSDRIKKGVRENYGFLGQRFADFVGRKNISSIYNQHDNNVNVLLSKMLKKDSLSNRMANKMAPIVSTAELINEYFNENIINVQEIIDMIVKQEQDAHVCRDVNQQFYDKLLSYLNRFHNHFDICLTNNANPSITKNIKTGTKTNKYGMIKFQQTNSYVLFDSEEFRRFLKNEEITEWHNIRKAMETKKVLIKRDSDHYVHHANKDFASPHYKFLIKEFDEANRTIYGYSEEIMNSAIQTTPICNDTYDEDFNNIF